MNLQIHLWRQLELCLAGDPWGGPTTEVICFRSEDAEFYSPALIGHTLRAALRATSSLLLLACSAWYLEKDGRQGLAGAHNRPLVVIHRNCECHGEMGESMSSTPVSLFTFCFFT